MSTEDLALATATNIKLESSRAVLAAQLAWTIELFGSHQPRMRAVLVDGSGAPLSAPLEVLGALSIGKNSVRFCFGEIKLTANRRGLLSAVRFYKPDEPGLYVEHSIVAFLTPGCVVTSTTT